MKPYDLHTLLQNTILNAEPLIHSHLQQPPLGSIEDRVGIYVNGYLSRLKETLANDFPCTRELLGEGNFQSLSENYIKQYPSNNFSVNYFGANLSKFLKEQNVPIYATEIANLEWEEYLVLVAADADILKYQDMQNVPQHEWPDLQFALHPSCRFISLQWNSMDYLEAFRDKKEKPKLQKLKSTETFFLWRNQQAVHYQKLNSLELITLNALATQKNVAEICALLAEVMDEEEVPAYFVQEIASWIHSGIFSKFIN